MLTFKNSAIFIFIGFAIVALSSCGPPGDARKYPPNPDARVKKNSSFSLFRSLSNFAGFM